MGIERLHRADDPRVAVYRGIRDGDLVRAHGLFVAEGRQVVQRVLADRRFRVQSMLLNDAALRELEPLMPGTGAAIPIFVGDAQALADIAGYDVRRGCLALVQRPEPLACDDLIASARSLVVLEAVANADNVGGVFRNAAAFGVGGVLLSPTCCDPLYRKAIRTSMGTVLRVPFARAGAADWPLILARIRAAGFTIAALTPRGPAEMLQAFAARPRPSRLALILGTEGAGLTPEVEAAADHRVRIPIDADVDSLNLATAAGIALYELRT